MAGAPGLFAETGRANISAGHGEQIINEHEIDELPLNGRNQASLVLLTPGTVDCVPDSRLRRARSAPLFTTESVASMKGLRQ